MRVRFGRLYCIPLSAPSHSKLYRTLDWKRYSKYSRGLMGRQTWPGQLFSGVLCIFSCQVNKSAERGYLWAKTKLHSRVAQSCGKNTKQSSEQSWKLSWIYYLGLGVSGGRNVFISLSKRQQEANLQVLRFLFRHRYCRCRPTVDNHHRQISDNVFGARRCCVNSKRGKIRGSWTKGSSSDFAWRERTSGEEILIPFLYK